MGDRRFHSEILNGSITGCPVACPVDRRAPTRCDNVSVLAWYACSCNQVVSAPTACHSDCRWLFVKQFRIRRWICTGIAVGRHSGRRANATICPRNNRHTQRRAGAHLFPGTATAAAVKIWGPRIAVRMRHATRKFHS